jgi:hypothetical protein
MLSALGGQIMDIIFNPSLTGLLLLVTGIAVWILLVLGAQVLVTRQRGAKP